MFPFVGADFGEPPVSANSLEEARAMLALEEQKRQLAERMKWATDMAENCIAKMRQDPKTKDLIDMPWPAIFTREQLEEGRRVKLNEVQRKIKVLQEAAAELRAEAEEMQTSDNEKATSLLKEAEAVDGLLGAWEIELQATIDCPKHWNV
jgi:hypothetical protein